MLFHFRKITCAIIAITHASYELIFTKIDLLESDFYMKFLSKENLELYSINISSPVDETAHFFAVVVYILCFDQRVNKYNRGVSCTNTVAKYCLFNTKG